MKKISIYMRQKFDEFLAPASDGSKESLYRLFIVSILITLFIFIVAFLTLFINQHDKAGTFGDFIGGTLNPILTFLTFMALLITIVLQQTELKETRTELSASARALEAQLNSLERKNFESMFFHMLSIHNSIVESIDLQLSMSGSNYKKGRDCFLVFYSNYKTSYRLRYNKRKSLYDEAELIRNSYQEFWNKRRLDLSHYYRYLYNFMKFLYECGDVEDKMRYAKILRAQLSDYELLLLFYNSLSKNGINFWLYIHEFKLFDNLPEELLLNPKHKKFYSPRSFGEPKTDKPQGWPPADLAKNYEEAKQATANQDNEKPCSESL